MTSVIKGMADCHKVICSNNLYPQIIYKLEYNKARPKGYTTIHDTPMLLHVRQVKDKISEVSKLHLACQIN